MAFSGVCDLRVHDTFQAVHKMVTRISNQVVEYHGVLRQGFPSFLILEAQCQYVGERWILANGPNTKVYPRQANATSGVTMVIETCSGMGAMGVGFAYSGMRTLALNDVNPIMCDLARRHRPQTPVIQGDIGDLSTISALADLTDCPVSLAAGIACQPYSQLGDGAAGQDPRAASLPSTLRAAYYLGSPVLILECVEQAGTQQWVQSMLQQFCQQTGYQIQQKVLHLEHLWISKRSRWWCVLVHPSLEGVEVPALPRLEDPPVVADFFAAFWECTKPELSVLECDLYEVRTFRDFGGLDMCIIQPERPCRTCLHSCGSQLSSCPCGCRKNGFTMDRIREKGLHGILIPLPGVLQHPNGETLPRVRHVHPWELSLLTGLPPEWPWAKDLKEALVGIGQLASPLQSSWVASQVIQMLRKQGLLRITDPSPTEALGNLVHTLFRCRDHVFGATKHARLEMFERRILQLLGLVPVIVENTNSIPMGVKKPKVTTHTADTTSVNNAGKEAKQAPLTQQHPGISTQASQALQAKGAVPGFGNNTLADKQETETNLEEDSIPPSPASIPDTMPYTVADESPIAKRPEIRAWIQTPGQSEIFPVMVPPETTVGMLQQAEARLSGEQGIHTPISLLGEAWPLGMKIEDGQIILTRDGTQWNPTKCILAGGKAPQLNPDMTRQEALFAQEGWIAVDEMKSYLHSLVLNSDYKSFPPIEFKPEQDWDHQIASWIGKKVKELQASTLQGIASAALVQQHWVPVIIRKTPTGLCAVSTPDSPELLAAVHQWTGVSIKDGSATPLPHAFRADCGWQTLAWIIALTEDSPLEAVEHTKACGLRTAFLFGLRHSGEGQKRTDFIRLGGMIASTEVNSKLMVLLQEHGVPADIRAET